MIFHIPMNPIYENAYRPDYKETRWLIQYCQLPDKISSDISRDMWNFSRCFKIVIFFVHDIYRGL
jgi:hypothetical protein